MGLVASDIAKNFGKTKVLDRVSFEVKQGEFWVILGASGCGKSTLLNCIAGLELPTSGKFTLDGQDITHRDPSKRNIAFVFQSYALYPHLNIFNNISFSLQLQKVPKEEINKRVHEVAKKLNLEELLDRLPSQLSGGQRQRVAMGRAIIRHPKVFLFDEPLSNLDVALRMKMRLELVNLHKSQNAISVYVTHDQHEAMTMADKIIILNKGKIEQIGSPSEVYDQPKTQFVAEFIGSPKINILETNKLAANSNLDASIVGIRPEKLHVSANGGSIPDSMIHFEAQFLRQEYPGGEYLNFFQQGENILCAKTETALSLSGKTTLYFNPHEMLTF